MKDAEDVIATVLCAARHGLSVSTQPVGHGATTALNGTVLLRTGALQDFDIDVERRVARVGAGVKWGTLLAALEPTGLTALAGSSPDPSVVGFTLGGGLSWFSRALGLCAHSAVAFDIVDADGVRRRITSASDPDLFWALRGGGGDFGVVLAVEIALHDAGPLVGGRLMWPLEMARPVLQGFRRITAEAPDQLTLWAHLFRFPPMPELPELLRGRAFVSVDLTFLGSQTELDTLLAPLRRAARAGAWTRSARSHCPSSAAIAAEPVDPMPTQEYSELLRTLDDATVDRLVDAAGAGADLPLAVVQIRHLGGALARATRRGRTQRGRSTRSTRCSASGSQWHLACPRRSRPRSTRCAPRWRTAKWASLLQLPGRGVRPRVHLHRSARDRLRKIKATTDPETGVPEQPAGVKAKGDPLPGSHAAASKLVNAADPGSRPANSSNELGARSTARHIDARARMGSRHSCVDVDHERSSALARRAASLCGEA